MTFSVLALDPVTGDVGVASQSNFLAVGAVVTHAAAGAGAVATQALANGSYGPRGLALLAAGRSAQEALDELVGSDDLPHRRQAAIVDEQGRAAAHTGSGCSGWSGALTGAGFACVGNMLAGPEVLEALRDAVQTGTGSLASRLVAALDAGLDAGGDARGQQSASVVVCRAGGGYGGHTDRLVDLRVDDHRTPVTELRRLLDLHELFFTRPAPEDLLPLDEPLVRELTVLLRAVGHSPGGEDLSSVWTAFDRWAGKENLEERLVSPGESVDPLVLGLLRRRAGHAPVQEDPRS